MKVNKALEFTSEFDELEPKVVPYAGPVVLFD